METYFKKLENKLQSQNRDLISYLEFLQIQEHAAIPKITQLLMQQDFQLSDYFNYLEKALKPSETPTLSELQAFRNLSIHLLATHKISLDEINQWLRTQATESIQISDLLQYLFRQHRLSVQEFLDYLERSVTQQEISDSCYELKKTANAVEFFIKSEHFSQRDTFASFFLLGELGRGGMGVVYKAYHPGLSRIVALKVFLPEKASVHLTQRFCREIQVMAKLNHPNIVQVFSAGEQDQKPYLVMEFVPGKTLEAFESTENENRGILLIFQKILLALHYMHQQGIIHRDLKPANIFLTPDGEPKIGDFGLAQEMDSRKTKLTQQGILIGTLPYMSPEQVQGKPLTPRSDIYSVGVCLYELLTKKLPHQSQKANELLHQILHQEPLLPSQINPQIHKSLEQILLKALEKSPEQRYASAEAFANDIEHFCSGQVVVADHSRLQRKYLRFYKQYRWFLFLLAPTLLFCLSAFVFLKISQDRDRQKQFSTALGLARQESALAQSREAVPELKLQYFFSALLSFNLALSYRPEHPETEREKRVSLEKFIAFACQKESYQLAQYLVFDAQKLSTLSEQEKNKISDAVHHARTKRLRSHLKRLEYWINLLKGQSEISTLRREAIFEISAMKEEQVLQKLSDLLEEAVQYALTQPNLSPKRIQFYEIFIEAVGRIQNLNSGPFLLEKIKQLQQYSKARIQEVPYIQLMATLTNALGYLQDAQQIENIFQIRRSMSESTLFLNLTQRASSDTLQTATISTETLQSAHEYLDRACYKFEKKDFAGALSDCDAGLVLEPKSPLLYFLRGSIRQEQKEYEASLSDFNESIRLFPKNSDVFLLRGNSYQYLKQWDLALNDYQKALELDPNNLTVYNTRCALKYSLADFPGVLADLNEVIRIDPSQDEPYAYRGTIKANLKDFAGALQDLDQAIQMNPHNYNNYNTRGLILFQQKKFAEASKNFEEAIRMNPQDGHPYYNRARLKKELKDFQGALLDYNEAVRLTPTSILFLYDQGMMRHLLNDKVGAFRDFQKVLKMIDSDPSPGTKALQEELFQKFPELKK